MARRLVEAGVRFVEVTMGGWDHHRNLKESLSNSCSAIDKPIAGLLADLQGTAAQRQMPGPGARLGPPARMRAAHGSQRSDPAELCSYDAVI